MGFTYFFFYVGIIVAIVGGIWLVRRLLYNRKITQTEKQIERTKFEEQMAFDNASVYDKLRKIQIGNLIVHWEKNYQVLGKMKLVEMTWDENDNHLETGRFFPILSVDDKKALISMPKGEGADIIWFFLQRQSIEKPLTPFFLGTDDNPGPAMQFADSDQTADVFFSLPNEQEQWKMVDVGSFFFEAEGENFVEGKGETRHVLAQSKDAPKRYMLYFDLLEGQGSNAFYVGETLNPESEIEYILRNNP
jgi:hypothetical protein